MVADSAPKLRVAIAGAGFSGAILARQLSSNHNVKVVVYEKSEREQVTAHWTQPVTGAGLNINANALSALHEFDPDLEQALREAGLPRRHVCAKTITGDTIYKLNIVEEGLADTYGVRIRWDDANRLMRTMAGDCIQWGQMVVDYSISGDGFITVELEDTDGGRSFAGPFDLLVAGDGRYSSIRSKVTGTPVTNFGDMCNFRILVPNAQADGSPWKDGVGLFDDLQLFYNDSLSTANIPPNSEMLESEDFLNVVMRSTPRVGIMRVPKSAFREDVGESLYIFGNFAIPDGGEIPECAKTSEAMRVLFTPAESEHLTPEGSFIRDTLVNYADRMHWARFQDIPVVYRDGTGSVLLLGDASHAFPPSLGQGATSSIEDACVAGEIVLRAVGAMEEGQEKSAAVAWATAEVERRQQERMCYLRDISKQACQHLHFLNDAEDGRGCLAEEALAWTDDGHGSGWREKARQMWKGYPLASGPWSTLSSTRASDSSSCHGSEAAEGSTCFAAKSS